MQPVRLLFARPPGPDSEFVEAEDIDGNGVKVGEWSKQGDYWVLTILAEAPIKQMAHESEETFNSRKARIERVATEMRKGIQDPAAAVGALDKAASVWP